VPGGGAGRGRPGGRGARRAGTARAAAGVRRRLGAVSVAERLAAELFAALDVGLALAEAGDAARAIAALAPAERSLVARAAPERVAAFALGRHAAHAALARLGAPDVPLLAGADRAPCWPAGFVGSIAHAGGLAVAVAARAEAAGGLGIDVEPERGLESELWPSIATASELAWLRSLPAERGGRAALAVFCAKEAVFKAWYPRGRRILEFAEVELPVPLAEARAVTRVAAPQAEVVVRLTASAGFLFAGAVATFAAPGTGEDG